MKNPNIPALPDWARPLCEFVPRDEREATEQKEIIELIALVGDRILTRDCEFAHMTASSVIVNRERTKTLFAFHKIYNSWAWTGGHADGESDFEATARREAQEETGILDLVRIGTGIASMEILPVHAHVKRGKTVGTHIHLNVSYLFEADEALPLRVSPDENSAVGWQEIARLSSVVSEPEMIPIYERLLKRANDC